VLPLRPRYAGRMRPLPHTVLRLPFSPLIIAIPTSTSRFVNVRTVLCAVLVVSWSLTNPAAYLVYAGKTASATLIRDHPLHLVAKNAGHRIQVIEDPAGLDNALKAGKYDLVVTDVANARELSERVLSAPSKPVLLPVAFQASKEEQSAAQKRYHCLLKAPSNSENYLVAIDQAMDWKLKATNR
jgi:hypothetical protein